MATLGVVAAAGIGTTDSAGGRLAHVVVKDVGGATLGTVNVFAERGKVAMAGRLTGLAGGFHGFHVHAAGICDPRATDQNGNVVPFGSAGPHLNPSGAAHGGHSGDLPLLYVAGDGSATTATSTDRLTPAMLFDADRSALIIHAAPDNYANIPARYLAAGVPGPDAATLATGDAGGRVACGVFVRG